MGFFSKLKNTFTGGWADVAVDFPDTVKRGERLPVQVKVKVKDEAISVSRVYVQLRCQEVIQLKNYRTLDRDDPGDVDNVDVNHSEELLDTELTIERSQELAANQEFSFSGEVDIPANLPPSFDGRNCRVVWSLFAGLDMTGNDPDSGWINVKVV